jgi:hypothetical protein
MRIVKSIKIIVFLTFILLSSCSQEGIVKQEVFELLQPEFTGVDFSNNLTYSDEFNVYKYRNYYNGGGVGIGDFNNDGLQDIYFTANQLDNKLYLNKGDFKFEDITESAGVKGERPWSTGVSIVDINSDGFLDIYVCNSGDLQGENKHNELFINNGDLTFKESAAEYNLDDKGFSTHASFFDFDKDGDLDVYILNNSYQAIGSFDLRRNERPKRDVLGGDKLMENVDGKFVDISQKAGIYGSVIGFGLGVTVGDVNNDGWEDIYVSNDFFERDYLYINNQDGTFSEELEEQINATSGASMGADMADVNNDGYNDIFVTDMLPSEYDRLKTVTTFEDWNKYILKVNEGYHHQFTRNTFQLNNGNNSFSEVSRFSGIQASDWSWGALFFDMDNDGFKDLFIANGIYQDLTNQDYLQYISNEEVIKSIIANDKVDYKRLIDIIPVVKVKNHAYKNTDGLSFKEYHDSGLLTESFSNGAAYGDLDNDGDLDLVVNNLNMESFIYRNNTIETSADANYIKFDLKGKEGNTFAVGSKVEILNYGISKENQPVRGFQSSVDTRLNIGLPNNGDISARITWPSGMQTLLENIAANQTIIVEEDNTKVENKLTHILDEELLFKKANQNIDFLHQENIFVDFHRDRLLSHMCSTEGPRISLGDVNNDSFEDLFVGGSKNNSGELFLGSQNGFTSKPVPDFAKNSNSEDMESLFFDADNDGDLDLYVCSGGVEYSQYSSEFYDRLYFNDGSGNYTLSDQKLPVSSSTNSTSTVISTDFDKDGDLDLFVGERVVPLRYGQNCSGYILENDGKGNLTNATPEVAPDLIEIGMITDAEFQDLDGDGDEDLILVGEFMGVEIFNNYNGVFTKLEGNNLSNLRGWWNSIYATDIDNDGDIDLVGGNHGLNSVFKATDDKPITLYSKDFDGNGFVDPILTFRADNGKDYPYALRHNLIDQIKSLKKKFPDYESFKDADINVMFTSQELEGVDKVEANFLTTTLFINNGGFNFEIVILPNEAQLSPIYAIASDDFDGDGDIDIVLGGNLYNVKPEVGRYDASYGVYLENKGDFNFKTAPNGSGFSVKGEIRGMETLNNQLLVSRNRDSILIFNYGKNASN